MYVFGHMVIFGLPVFYLIGGTVSYSFQGFLFFWSSEFGLRAQLALKELKSAGFLFALEITGRIVKVNIKTCVLACLANCHLKNNK